MAEEATIQGIQYKISGDAEQAAKGLDNLAKSLGTLKEALGNNYSDLKNLADSLAPLANTVKDIGGGAAVKMKTLASGLTSLNELGRVRLKIPDELPSAISSIGKATDGLSAEASAKLQDLGVGLKALSNVGDVKFKTNLPDQLVLLAAGLNEIKEEHAYKLLDLSEALKTFSQSGADKAKLNPKLGDQFVLLAAGLNEIKPTHPALIREIGEALAMLNNFAGINNLTNLPDMLVYIAAAINEIKPDGPAKLMELGNALIAFAELERSANFSSDIANAATGLGNLATSLARVKSTASIGTDLKGVASGLRDMQSVVNDNSFAAAIASIVKAENELNAVSFDGIRNATNALRELSTVAGTSDPINAAQLVKQLNTVDKELAKTEEKLESLQMQLQATLNSGRKGPSFEREVAQLEMEIDKILDANIALGMQRDELQKKISDSAKGITDSLSTKSLENVAKNMRSISGSIKKSSGEIKNATSGISSSSGLAGESKTNFGAVEGSSAKFEEAKKELEKYSQSLGPIAQKIADSYQKIFSASKAGDMKTFAKEQDNLKQLAESFVSTRNEAMQAREEIIRFSDQFGEWQPPDFSAETQSVTNVLDAVSKLNNIQAAISAVNMLYDAFKRLASSAAKAALQLGKLALTPVTVPLRAAANAAEKFRKKLKDVISSLKRIAYYRAVRWVIKEISEAFREGTNNAYQWAKATGHSFAASMDSAATSLLYFKNSIGAAMVPILQAVIPVMNAIIDKVVEVINTFNELIAKLSGSATWVKAIRYPVEYAEAAETAAEETKKALVYLAPFDELNVLPSENDNDKGKKKKDELDYSKMFEEVPTGEIGGALAEIFDVFKKAWENEGQNTIDAIKKAFNSLKDLGASIGQSFLEVFTNGTGQKSLETILRIVQNIAGVVSGLADGFREAWERNSLGTAIIQHLWDALNDVLVMWERITGATKAWAENLNFGGVMLAIEKLTGAFEPLVKVITDGLAWAWENILLPFGKWAIESAAVAVINLLTAAFEALTAIINAFKPAWDWLWENFLQPVAHFVGDALIGVIQSLTDILKGFADFLNGEKSFKEFIDGLSGWEVVLLAIVTAITAVISVVGIAAGLFNGIYAVVSAAGVAFRLLTSPVGIAVAAIAAVIAIGVALYKNWDKIAEIAKQVWENVLKVFQGVADGIATAAATSVQILKQKFEFLKNALSTIITAIKGVFSGLITFVTGVFTGNWEKAWEGVKTIFESIFNGIKDFFKITVNSVLGFAESLVNGFIRIINSAINAINSLSFDVPDWVPGIGGETFGFNIRNIQEVSIPRLASGGMVDNGQLFIARESGPELVGKMNNSTTVANNAQIVDGIRQGVEDANAEEVAVLYQLLRIAREIAAKDTTIRIDSSEISRAQRRTAKALGASL